MTLVNAWWERDGSGDGEESRCVAVQCDGCLPVRFRIATGKRLSAIGWRFDDLETGAHYCPWCAGSQGHRGPRRYTPPQEHPALPNLLIVGAAKCGTTSLHRYLTLHPQIHMSESKEVNFFQDPGCLEKLDVYATFFDREFPVRGESSPIYTWHPLAPGLPDRIRTAIPDVKLIYLVRDPVERAISHYVEARAGAVEERPLEEAFRTIDDPHHRYVASGKYANQLEQYTRLFPFDQLLVVDQSELLSRRRETLRRIFRFLEVDETFVSSGFGELANVRGTRLRKTSVNDWLRRSRLADAVRRLPPKPRGAIFRPAKRLTSRKVELPSADEDLRDRLRQVFREDVERLRELTGQEFATWRL